jgi:hypothetical protein
MCRDLGSHKGGCDNATGLKLDSCTGRSAGDSCQHWNSCRLRLHRSFESRGRGGRLVEALAQAIVVILFVGLFLLAGAGFVVFYKALKDQGLSLKDVAQAIIDIIRKRLASRRT